MERTYRAALIGCGNMGRNHALALATTPGIQLCALADVHEPSLVRMADGQRGRTKSSRAC